MMIRRIITTFLIAGVWSLAIAQQGPLPVFQFDTDGDGLISEEEFDRGRAERMAARAAEGRPMYRQGSGPAFSDLDADGDGMLSEQEILAFHQARMLARRGNMPRWSYGYPGGMATRRGFNPPQFAQIDANGDGCINQAELEQFQQARRSRMGGPGGNMPGRGAGFNMPRYQQFDLDGDGRISQAEFLQAREQRMAQRAMEGRMMRGMDYRPSFEDIDSDNDGAISEEEFSKHQQSHHRMMRGQAME